MKETLLTVKNLSVSYSKTEAIKDVAFEVEKGDFVCIIGQNGGGKTTLINTILGFLKQNSGEIKINTKNISFVPQNASVDKNFPITVIETVLSAFLKNGIHLFKFFSKKEKENAKSFLKQIGLENNSEKLINELSGGEFQRLLIARALASNPEILILDEPTSNVDAISKEKIYRVLKDLNAKGITIIMVTHDLDNITHLTNRIISINHSVSSYKIKNGENSFLEVRDV